MRHHLVVLRPVYLDLVLAGRKRVECRLSSVRRPPFGVAQPGDLLWLKLPSGPVCAVAVAGRCQFVSLRAEEDLERVSRQYGPLVGAADGFFEEAKPWARFCSLIWIETVVSLRPMTVFKSDQRAWVVLDAAPRPGMRVPVGAAGRPDRPAHRPSSTINEQPYL